MRRRVALGIAALLSALVLVGCSTVAPVADTAALAVSGYAYSGGKATQEFRFTRDTVQKAVLEAMDDLRMVKTKETHDGVVVLLEARTTDDRRTFVTLRPHQEMTRVTIKVFWLGDEPYSRAFMDRIGVRLGTLPPAPIPEKVPSSPTTLISPNRSFDMNVLEKQAEQRYHPDQLP